MQASTETQESAQEERPVHFEHHIKKTKHNHSRYTDKMQDKNIGMELQRAAIASFRSVKVVVFFCSARV
jgi:hypothetical protein